MCLVCNNLKTNNVLRIDPSRTKTLRDAFVRQMNVRFGKVKKAVNRVFNTKEHSEVILNIYAFATDKGKIEEFRKWLDSQIELNIFEKVTLNPDGSYNVAPELWTDYYIDSAYKKGIRRGKSELNKILPADSTSRIIDYGFASPIAGATVENLFTRTFNELKGVTDYMGQQISRILSDGLINGQSPRVIARTMAKEIDTITAVRARVIARTEIIRSHHLANIAEYEKAGIQGVKVQAEWSTAGFNVCPECDSLEGRVFPLEEIRGMIPKHPNCRCVAIPYLEDFAEK